MRALETFTVGLRVPAPLEPLRQLALNLRWAWDAPTRDLFRSLAPDRWEAAGGDPLRLLASLGARRLETLAADPDVVIGVRRLHDRLVHYLEGDGRSESDATAVGG